MKSTSASSVLIKHITFPIVRGLVLLSYICSLPLKLLHNLLHFLGYSTTEPYVNFEREINVSEEKKINQHYNHDHNLHCPHDFHDCCFYQYCKRYSLNNSECPICSLVPPNSCLPSDCSGSPPINAENPSSVIPNRTASLSLPSSSPGEGLPKVPADNIVATVGEGATDSEDGTNSEDSTNSSLECVYETAGTDTDSSLKCVSEAADSDMDSIENDKIVEKVGKRDPLTMMRETKLFFLRRLQEM